ncbi:MAG: hypothetical protein E7418_02125 [Ruminococcaceae bacterium]|nr:hypothetical protein [Oscillospiraceae bacterium]
MNQLLQDNYGIRPQTVELMKQAEAELTACFLRFSEKASFNQAKVLAAFHREGVSERHLLGTTGYGYDDVGRDALDRIYAEVMGAEAALVRQQFVSGTHALSACFFGLLRPGDTLLFVTGTPYDTLEEVAGLRLGAEDSGSLADWGVKAKVVALREDGTPDYELISAALDDSVKVVAMQRSKGYAWRNSISVEELGKLIQFVKEKKPSAICMVDNCYGEFVEEKEPTEVGADIIAGSLIKNPGGGLAPTGGYVAGKKDLVEKIACRLTSPGIGAEVGATLDVNRLFYQGLFLAPHTVLQSLKAAALAAKMLELSGFEVSPRSEDARTDIIQAIKLGDAEKVCAFCRGIQKGSPVDSNVTPEPWDMPGYESPVIMAAGTFISGASIEISADAPIRPPYAVYLQGGLTYESAKIALLCAIDGIL